MLPRTETKEFPIGRKELPHRFETLLDKTVLKDSARMIFSKMDKSRRLRLPLARFIASARLLCRFLAWAVLITCGQMANAANPPLSSVKLAWDPSPDATVTGCRIFYGVAHAQYTNGITVGNVTSNTVPGLVNGTTYFFAVAAYNASGMQSPLSNEITYTVRLPRLRIRTNPARQMILTVEGQVGHSYNIEATQNLNTWSVIGAVTPGAGGTVDFTNANAVSFSKRFYRLRDTTP